MLMTVDSVDSVAKTMPCFHENITPLLLLLLSVDIVDVVLRAKRLKDIVLTNGIIIMKLLLAKAFVDRC